MRLHYRSMTRPKHVARRLHTIFPALSLSTAQNWTAQLMGYRSWHELQHSLVPGDEPETADIQMMLSAEGVQNPEEMRTLFLRSNYQQEVLVELVGPADVIDLPGMFFAVDPNRSGFPFKKLGTTGKGNAFFRGLAYDLYDSPCEGDPGGGSGVCESVGFGDDAPYVHMGLPDGADEAEFNARLLKNIQDGDSPYPSFAKVAQKELTLKPFGSSTLQLEVYDGAPECGDPAKDLLASQLAIQKRRMRLFLLDDEDPIGFVVITTTAMASGFDKRISFRITIEDAWSWFDEDTIESAFTTSIATSVSTAITRVLWMRVGSPHKEVDVIVETESESPLSWAITDRLCDMLPDVVGDGETRGMDSVSYSASVCP